MRVTSIFVAASLALFANAQTSTGNNTPSSTQDAASAAQSSAQAAILDCLEDCDPGNVNCRAACLTVPFPNDQQANATNTCVSGCPVGEGSEADNNAYTTCVRDCISENYYSPSSGTPQPTGGASNGNNGNGNGNSDDDDSNNGNGDSTDNDDATNTGDSEGTQTSDGPSPSESTAGAALIGASSGVVGILGFVAAVMAL